MASLCKSGFVLRFVDRFTSPFESDFSTYVYIYVHHFRIDGYHAIKSGSLVVGESFFHSRSYPNISPTDLNLEFSSRKQKKKKKEEEEREGAKLNS